jgi:hypothetical protein
MRLPNRLAPRAALWVIAERRVGQLDAETVGLW